MTGRAARLGRWLLTGLTTFGMGVSGVHPGLLDPVEPGRDRPLTPAERRQWAELEERLVRS
ncbi:hypothetical protein [Amycolatopsis sp. NPDC021455]|uniref:hypothetical protein n=1 Tax=Amycolatopsis sp. NPDC021455 TaxID=3154901 RepID=UPI0033F54D90